MMLYPTKKDVEHQTDQGTPAYPLSSFITKNSNHPWQKDDPREKQIDDENEIPGNPMLKKRREDHGPIRGEEIEDYVADQNWETNLIKAPKIRTPRDFNKNPTEKKSIKRN